MKVDARSRWQYRLQSGMFVLLFVIALGLLAWISNRFPVVFDLSSNQRNSLSSETLTLLNAIDEPLKITLFISPVNDNKRILVTLFERYQHEQPNIQFASLNPDLYPELLRDNDIRFDGEVLFEYLGRSEKLSQITEAQVSNVIQRLLRMGERWLVFVQGHGEPDPYGDANHDFSQLSTQLASKGYNIETLNLAQANSIPDNTDVLILASPRIALLPGEITLLRDYIDDGGNLLWLADPEQVDSELGIIAESLEVEFLPGVIVDPNSQLMGLDRVDFALVAQYPRHPVTQYLDSMTLFPKAQAIEFYGEENWQQQLLLQTDSRSWSETGALKGEIFYGDHPDEVKGPLTIGLTLERSHQDADGALFDQRVAIIGDVDFLSNSYLGNGSNLDIGVNLMNWLGRDDSLISINPRPAPDTRLVLSQAKQLFIAITFLIGIPALLIATGMRIWLKRRKS